LVIVKEGTLEVTINGASRTAGPGSMFFFASGDLHGLRNVGEGDATYYVIRIYPHDLPPATKS
jgi:quercetin dioxygenase-like cupin family protein